MTTQEEKLLKNFRLLTEKERGWLLALSEQCCNQPAKDKDEVLYTVRVSGARE